MKGRRSPAQFRLVMIDAAMLSTTHSGLQWFKGGQETQIEDTVYTQTQPQPNIKNLRKLYMKGRRSPAQCRLVMIDAAMLSTMHSGLQWFKWGQKTKI